MPLLLLEPGGELPQADDDGDRDHADEDGLDDEQRGDDHRAEPDADPYGGAQVTARALLLRRAGGSGAGHGLLRRLVTEQGAAAVRGSRPLAGVPVVAVSACAGTSGTMGMGRVCCASCASYAGPAGAAPQVSGGPQYPALGGAPQEESFIRPRAARLPCA